MSADTYETDFLPFLGHFSTGKAKNGLITLIKNAAIDASKREWYTARGAFGCHVICLSGSIQIGWKPSIILPSQYVI